MTLWRAVLLTLIFMAVSGGRVAAADYTLATGTDYPPFVDAHANGGGLSLNIVRGAFAAIGKTVDIQVLPWTRGYDMVKAGHIDGIFPYIPTPERMAEMTGSDPMFVLQSRIWSSPSHPIQDLSEMALLGSRICLPLGYAMPDIIQAMLNKQELSLVRPPSLMNCLTMIAGYHADGVVADVFIMHAAGREAGISLAPGKDVLKERPLEVMAPKNAPKSSALIADFNRGLAAIRADGTYARLLQQADLH